MLPFSHNLPQAFLEFLALLTFIFLEFVLGFYRVNCKLSCNCPNMDYCNPVDGRCLCKEGYKGRKCDEPCVNNTYGEGCSKKCKCLPSMICDHITGECYCKSGFFGSDCNKLCEEGRYGKNCSKR